MPRSRATTYIATSLLITAAGVAVGLLWASRRPPPGPAVVARPPAPSRARIVPSRAYRASDGVEPELTAVPRAPGQRLTGADDYEAIGPDQLGEAFLTRATESWASIDESVDVDLQGFQLATVEDLTTPELRDDPADFDIPEKSG